jgi:hypothetical protein
MTRQEILDIFKTLEKEFKNKEGETAQIGSELINLRLKYEKVSEGKPLKWAVPLPVGKGPQNSQ